MPIHLSVKDQATDVLQYLTVSNFGDWQFFILEPDMGKHFFCSVTAMIDIKNLTKVSQRKLKFGL